MGGWACGCALGWRRALPGCDCPSFLSVLLAEKKAAQRIHGSQFWNVEVAGGGSLLFAGVGFGLGFGRMNAHGAACRANAKAPVAEANLSHQSRNAAAKSEQLTREPHLLREENCKKRSGQIAAERLVANFSLDVNQSHPIPVGNPTGMGRDPPAGKCEKTYFSAWARHDRGTAFSCTRRVLYSMALRLFTTCCW